MLRPTSIPPACTRQRLYALRGRLPLWLRSRGGNLHEQDARAVSRRSNCYFALEHTRYCTRRIPRNTRIRQEAVLKNCGRDLYKCLQRYYHNRRWYYTKGDKGLFVCLSAQWAGGHGGSDELQVQAVRATATSWLTTAAAARPCYTNPSPSERAAGAAAKDAGLDSDSDARLWNTVKNTHRQTQLTVQKTACSNTYYLAIMSCVVAAVALITVTHCRSVAVVRSKGYGP